jgi:hypothetical protein
VAAVPAKRVAGRPGGPADFGPGTFLGGAFKDALDTDKDDRITQAEFTRVFRAWFEGWDADHSKSLTDPELRAGITAIRCSAVAHRGAGGPFGGFGRVQAVHRGFWTARFWPTWRRRRVKLGLSTALLS